MFFIDVFNSGFDVDNFRIRIVDFPDAWQFRLFENSTGDELEDEGIYSVIPDIGSHKTMIIRMEVYPPSDRESQDIGLVKMKISSAGEADLETEIGFTVHRTFGVLVEVIADSDSGILAHVGPVAPGGSMWFNLRISDSSDNGGSETTWRIIKPDALSRNTDTNPNYANWDYSISNDTLSDIVVVTTWTNKYVDLKLDIGLLSEVEAGNHTIYTRIVEEGVDAESARYFDLPVVIEVQKDVRAGRLEVTQKGKETRFSPDETKNIEFKIDNQNNVPLEIVITLDEPSNWEGVIRASSDQTGGTFLLLTLPAYSSKDFSLAITPPDNLKDGETVEFNLMVTPMDEEVPYDSEYTQNSKHIFSTACEGPACFVNEIVNPEPQTMALGIGLAAVFVFAVYRRGQRSTNFFDEEEMFEEKTYDTESFASDTPEPVLEDDEDDDLELLDELDTL